MKSILEDDVKKSISTIGDTLKALNIILSLNIEDLESNRIIYIDYKNNIITFANDEAELKKNLFDKVFWKEETPNIIFYRSLLSIRNPIDIIKEISRYGILTSCDTIDTVISHLMTYINYELSCCCFSQNAIDKALVAEIKTVKSNVDAYYKAKKNMKSYVKFSNKYWDDENNEEEQI